MTDNFIQRPTGMDEDPAIADGNIRRQEVNVGGVFDIGGNHPPSPVVNEVDASVQQLLDQIDIDPETVPEPIQNPVVDSATNRRPNRVSYSKKKIVASKHLFIHPSHIDLYHDVNPWTMHSKIDECPNKKKNGNTFLVNWNLQTSIPSLPSDFNIIHVRNRLENTDAIKKQLKESIDLYELTVVVEEEAATSNVVETPVNDNRRYQAVASMRTAASSSRNSMDSHRATRNNSNTIESDSDTDGSGCVDGADDSDDFYPSYFYEAEDAKSLEEDIDSRTVGPESYSRLLDGISWCFRQVQEGVDLNVPARQMYNGPTGLRRGVAHSFLNPFECFQVCGGCTYEYVATLAANSNDYFDRHIRPNKNPSRWHGMGGMISPQRKCINFLVLYQVGKY